MLAGLAHPKLSELKLSKEPEAYRYLALSDCYKVDTIDDVEDFKAVVRSMQVI